MPRVLGYAEPLSVAPGEEIRFMVGTLDGPRRYRAEIVRVVSGDSGPDGPGLKTVHLPTSIDGDHAGAPQHIDAGSYVIVDHPEAFGDLARFTLQAFIQPTRVPIRPVPARQVIMGTWAQDRSAGFALMLDETGALAFLHGGTVVSTRVPLAARRWYHVGAAVDLVANTVTLRQTPLADHSPSLEPPVAVTASLAAQAGATRCALPRRRPEAVEDGRRRTTWHFNGKIDRPSLARRALTPAELQAAATARSTRSPTADAIGLWDLAADIGSDRVTDRSPNHLHGRTVNAPKRAVTGHDWDGSEMDWRRAPAAVRRDPLPRRRSLRRRLAAEPHPDRPDRTRAAASTRCSSQAERRPRVLGRVLRAAAAARAARARWRSWPPPPPTSPTRTIARACARARPSCSSARCPSWIRPTSLLMHHPELGGSTYDTHSDGSGVCHVSRLRPIVNTRPTGWLWNLFLDLCLLDWLEAQGQSYDVITDDDLHAEGLSLLADYRVVLTGCHPEYYSRRDAGRARRIPRRAAGGSCTWAATASTGASRIPPPTPG